VNGYPRASQYTRLIVAMASLKADILALGLNEWPVG
jgi:hypothetical protein